MAKVTRTNILIPVRRLCHKKYEALIFIILKLMTNVNLEKKGQMSRSKGLIPTVRSYH